MTRAQAGRRAALLAAVLLGLDQLTKALVRGGIDVGDEDPILPAVKLVHVKNDGIAFGALGGGGSLLVVLVGVALVAIAGFFWRYATASRATWVATGLLVGGALGNLVDRLAFGEVTDFLELPAWPSFNVADIWITFGVVALLVVLERDDRQERDEAARPA